MTATGQTETAVQAAYAECIRITGEQARNFSWGIRLLTAPKRRALSAVYATARRIDDIGDGDWSQQHKIDALGEMRAAVLQPAEHSDDPVLLALADAAERFPIPLDAFGDLIDGCEFDVAGVQITSWDDLLRYCRWVAGSIGRLSLGVFAPPLTAAEQQRAEGLADDLGVALQLTNILRDVREDFTMGRIYLPEDDLKLFSCQIELLPDGSLDPQGGQLAELIRYESARAWGWYDTGLALLPMLDRRSAACTGAMAGIYAELLTRISRRPASIFAERTSLPTRDKVRVAVGALVRGGPGVG
jgi:15-cis-phytoene synthase